MKSQVDFTGDLVKRSVLPFTVRYRWKDTSASSCSNNLQLRYMPFPSMAGAAVSPLFKCSFIRSVAKPFTSGFGSCRGSRIS